ncbi:hypothetical protein [Pseudomonas aeruginosa]|uniref:hypothetical protein n=1 Tax=Pseudomonas aeruginosa TaxID=287 RepID=UPI003992EF9F
MEQVARWPWNAWPDESGLGGRMAWNPQVEFAFRFRVAFSQEEAFDNISFRELKRWVTKMALYDDLDESFVDAIYGNLEEADQALARELFDETFDRDLVLPEEYTTSVADQLDALTKAAVSNAAQIA